MVGRKKVLYVYIETILRSQPNPTQPFLSRRKEQPLCVIALIFPVAIPIVPTIRVLVTFTKFEELQPVEEFSTPLSSPAHFQDTKAKQSDGSVSWMKGSHGGQSSDGESRSFCEEIDPFHIPLDYAWVDANERKRRMKAKKAKSRKHKKHVAPRNSDTGCQATDEAEE